MGKKSKITLIVLAALIGLIYAAYLFLVPALVDPNNFKPEIKKAVKEAAGLDFSAKNIELNTYFDLSAGVTLENAKIKNSENDPLLTVGKARIRIPLLPLIFKKIEIAEFSIDKPEIFLTRLKNGKYNVESIIEKTAPQSEKPVSEKLDKTPAQPSSPVFEPVFKDLDILISDYSVKLTDKTVPQTRHFTLKGNALKIEDFNPEKYAKLVAKGAFFVENRPVINYDIALATDIPVVREEKKEEEKASKPQVQSETPVNQASQRIDPIEGLLKYDFKGDIAADLRLKNRGNFPEIDGFLEFDRLSFKVDGQKLPDSHGEFKFSGKKTDINSKLYVTPESYIEIAGKIDNLAKQDFDINVKTTEIQLSDVKKFAYSFADAFNADVTPLNDIGLSGKLLADFNLKKDNYQGFLKIFETTVSHKGISQPLKGFNSTLNFDKDRIIIEKTAGSIGDIGFNATGDIASDLKTDIKAVVPNINLKTIINIVNNSSMLADLRPQLRDLRNVSGNLKAEALIKGRLDKKLNSELILTFDRIYAYHAPTQLPVSITKGNIRADEKKAELKDIKAVVSYSPIYISGQITDLIGDVDIDITANGKVSSADIKKYLPKEARKTVKVDDLPLLAKLTGSAEDFNVLAQTNIDNLATIVKIDQPAGVSNIINVDANVKPTTVSIRNSGLLAGSNLSKNKAGLYNLGSATKLVSINGDINSANTPDPYLHDIKIDISGLNLSLVEPKGNIQVNGNLLVKGRTSAPKAYGSLNIRNIAIPSMYLKTDGIDVALKEKEITVDTSVLNILDSKVALSAILENKLSPPYVVRSVNVNSDFMNIDKLTQTFAAQPAGSKPNKPVKRSSGGRKTSGGNNTQAGDIPVIIHNGTFSAKKLLVSNLMNKDMSFKFTIKPLNLLRIRKFTTHTGGGAGTGVIDMNLKTTKLNMDFTADEIEINALASTLAKTPNEIFGKMKGRIQLATIGQTPEAMTQNAVGRADFYIENGHMPRLANLQYLLGANNLSVKGVTDSLLSNTLQFEEAAKTNQFDTLEGLVLINRGALDVQEIKMKGKYLSSFISGTVQMGSNYADLTMLSTLSGRVVKNLGPVADLSVDKLIRQIPGEWGQLIADQRLKNQYPNRDRIPELNNDPLPNDKDFAVKINGVLGKPRAVRMFEWLPDMNR